MTVTSRWRATTTTVIVSLALVTATGCGIRLSHQRVLSDLRAASAGGGAGGGAGSGAGSGLASGQADSSGTSGGASDALAAGSQTGGQASQGVGGSSRGGGSAGGGAGSTGSGSGSSGAGSAGNGGGSGPNGSGGASVVGCSGVKAPIVIGTVGTQSGLVGSSVVEGVRAVQAWAAYANARGGVNCHPVKYVIYDDGGDPSRNQASAQRLVEQDHAIALVQADAPLSGQASVNYLTAKRVPVIGSETASPWFYSSPMYFPQASSGDNLTDLLIATLNKIGRSQGKTKLATLSCVETTTCSRFYSAAPSLAAKYGLALAYRGQASLAQPDFTSICQGAQSAGAQMIGIELDAASVQRVARSCATVNFHPQFGTVVNAAPIPPSDASLEGVAIGENVLPWMITSNPGIAQFHDALRQNAPGVQANPISVGGWVSAKLFEFAVQHVSETPSSQDVLNGLWSMKSNDLGGLTMPLTFVKDQNAPQTPTCYWLLQAKGGQYVSPDGGQRTCA